MSDYRYNLTLTGEDDAELSCAVKQINAANIVPDYLYLDAVLRSEKSEDGFFHLYFSSEHVSPYGTAPCWEPADHEKVLHKLSEICPSTMIKLTGEDIDDPNNTIFAKAFYNGKFKKVFQEKQDVDYLLQQEPWRQYGAPERVGPEAEVFRLFETISAQRELSGYQIAADMVWLQEEIELDDPDPLTPEVLYQLSSKLHKASYCWFTEPLLHEEFLDALRYLLEYGIKDKDLPQLPELGPRETLEFLLQANNDVFGTLVETAAVKYIEHYSRVFSDSDLQPVASAIEAMQTRKQPLAEQIIAAEGKAAAQADLPTKSIETPER